MKKLLFLILLTPLLNADWWDESNYTMEEAALTKHDGVLYIHYYCINGIKWMKIRERVRGATSLDGVHTTVMEKVLGNKANPDSFYERCSSLSKETWLKFYAVNR